MKKSILPIVFVVFAFFFVTISYKKNNEKNKAANPEVIYPEVIPDDFNESKAFPFDSTLVQPFFVAYPELKKYQSDVKTLYRKHQYNYIWYDNNRINEVGNLLYIKLNNLIEEGIEAEIPYKDTLYSIFQNPEQVQNPNVNDELLLSSLYFFYAEKVFHGLDAKKIAQMGWYLPRKKQSYVNYLDSLLTNPSLLNKDERELFGQYYRLRELLKKYRQMNQKGDWSAIETNPKIKSFKPGDSSKTIAQIRQRLYHTEDIATDSKSAIYDAELAAGILKFKKRNAYALDEVILPKHIAAMNVPLSERIKTIMVNMERCRWMCSCVYSAKELIFINIPEYQLTYFIDGKKALISEVVVGKAMNKTVVFSADMKYIVFSPYWNVPKSILYKEILPAINKNRNYLAQHEMEWHGNSVRQRPGPKNSLGLVKFLFPNNNAIYLHDTPSKDLFKQEKRAFSHGCIRVAKPVELANLILRDDPKWTPEKIDEAMNRGVESWYPLKNKIPVYIGYFTAWVDDDGTIHFYDDVYKRDASLASLLFKK
ncbi:MAG: L,D-transpeptidase family protein [Flavobacterium sp.]